MYERFGLVRVKHVLNQCSTLSASRLRAEFRGFPAQLHCPSYASFPFFLLFIYVILFVNLVVVVVGGGGGVVLTLTRIIKSVVTGQAPVTLELRNTPGRKTQIKGGTCIYHS